jgi:hypothetical protein
LDAATMQYHHDAMALLSEPPAFSAQAAQRLAKRERELGIVFPESVREWYSLEQAVDLLHRHSNDDNPVPIEKLGEPFPNWYGGGPRDFVAQGLVVFMHENQGVCNWAFRLDGSPDPEVVVEVDTAPNDEWLQCSDKFGTFVYCQIWDHRHALIREDCAIGISAQECNLAEDDLVSLKASFLQRPSTNTWPGNANYRFEAAEGGILIWEGKNQADWFVAAKTPASLRTLLLKIWHCGNLAETAYGLSPEADDILRALRGAEAGRSMKSTNGQR